MITNNEREVLFIRYFTYLFYNNIFIRKSHNQLYTMMKKQQVQNQKEQQDRRGEPPFLIPNNLSIMDPIAEERKPFCHGCPNKPALRAHFFCRH